MTRLVAAASRHPVATDTVLAVLLLLAAVVSVSSTFEMLRRAGGIPEPHKAPIYIALLAVTAPVALRRRFPMASAIAVIVAFTVGRILVSPDLPGLTAWEGYISVWACWLALYSVVAYRRATAVTAWVVAGLVVLLYAEVIREVFFYQKGGPFRGLPLSQAFLLAYNLVFISWPVALGAVVRRLRDRERTLVAQADELRLERAENARRAVFDERVRIARELHDVVAHHVSVMGIQAGAARTVMQRQPGRAQQVLTLIEESSRQAVIELHRLVGFLRRTESDGGRDEDLGPQPDLAQLPELIAKTRASGLNVDLVIEGETRPLGTTLELSAYRVVQEALTNTLKHSGASQALVRLIYADKRFDAEVTDNGRGPSVGPLPTIGGNGLVGMRERVSLHDGQLWLGPTSQGGFAVRASFPLVGASA